MAEPAIDPRYAAQFQRGYDPAVHTPVRERRGPAPISGGPPPMARRVPDPPARVPDPVPPGPDVAPADAPGDENTEETLVIAPRRAEWALLGFGLAMLVLAGVLFAKYVEIQGMYSGVGPEFGEQVLSVAAGTLPGPLLIAGVLALCAWVVLQAVRPRP